MEVSVALNVFRKCMEKFVMFNEAEWIVFTQQLKFTKVKKKNYFAEQGNICDKVGFLVTGTMRYFHVKDGQDITSYFSFENELVSSYKSYLTGFPSFSNIQALEDCELITFTRKDMDQMLENPLLAYKMEHFGRCVAEYTICCYDDRISSFINLTPEERYLNLFNTGREVLQRIPQHYIAHYLGITPVSLSRIRRRVMETVK